MRLLIAVAVAVASVAASAASEDDNSGFVPHTKPYDELVEEPGFWIGIGRLISGSGDLADSEIEAAIDTLHTAPEALLWGVLFEAMKYGEFSLDPDDPNRQFLERGSELCMFMQFALFSDDARWDGYRANRGGAAHIGFQEFMDILAIEANVHGAPIPQSRDVLPQWQEFAGPDSAMDREELRRWRDATQG